MPTLYLMLGYPGAGKTTTARIIHELTGAELIWADHERKKRFKTPTHKHEETIQLYDELNSEVEQLLAGSKSVVYDTNFNFYRDRVRLRAIASKYGAETKLIWVQTPRELARKRATEESDGRHTRVHGNMSVDDFERLSNNLEVPHDDESCITVDGTKVTNDYIRSLIGPQTV